MADVPFLELVPSSARSASSSLHLFLHADFDSFTFGTFRESERASTRSPCSRRMKRMTTPSVRMTELALEMDISHCTIQIVRSRDVLLMDIMKSLKVMPMVSGLRRSRSLDWYTGDIAVELHLKQPPCIRPAAYVSTTTNACSSETTHPKISTAIALVNFARPLIFSAPSPSFQPSSPWS